MIKFISGISNADDITIAISAITIKRKVWCRIIEPSLKPIAFIKAISDFSFVIKLRSISTASRIIMTIERFRKINRVNAIIAKFLTILKLQPNRATLRSDLTQAVR